MTNAAQIIAALPASAWVNGYYGARHVGHDWAAGDVDTSSITTRDPVQYASELRALRRAATLANAADLIALLPGLDDEAGWTALEADLQAELDTGGQAMAGDCGHAIDAVLISARQARIPVCEAAGRLSRWLGARALGQVGSHVLPAHAVAQASIYYTA